MMSNYVIVVYMNYSSWHVHGSHLVYLLKLSVTIAARWFVRGRTKRGGLYRFEPLKHVIPYVM
jgi:hypothetical protein